jgi:hypothetical protein
MTIVPRLAASRKSVLRPSSGRCLKTMMPKKGAAENETELAQKQKCVIEDRLRTPKRDRNEEHATPKCDLHQAENADRHEIRETIARQLVAWIDRELPELGKYLPSKRDCAQYLDSKQQQIRTRFRLFVGCFHLLIRQPAPCQAITAGGALYERMMKTTACWSSPTESGTPPNKSEKSARVIDRSE